MAKTQDAASVAESIIQKINEKTFAPVYLLMGEEPFYVDKVESAIISSALTDDERDFNQFIIYGADTSVEDVVSAARRYPMFAQRQVVVLREAQSLRNVEGLSVYTEAPLESTVLVIVYRGKCDKRKALYKSVSKNGIVLESSPLREYEMQSWIERYYRERGLVIDHEAAALFAEYAGCDLSKIAVETDKILKSLPEGTKSISVSDIETCIGVTREFSVFELCRQICSGQKAAALRTASYIGSAARFALPMVTSPLYSQFRRVLAYHALIARNPAASSEEKAAALGINSYFVREYETAARIYPLTSCMAVISLICEYDFKGKGGNAGEAPASELLMELLTRILS